MKILFPVSSAELDKGVLAWFGETASKFADRVDVLNVQHSSISFTIAYPAYPEFVFMSEKSDQERDRIAEENAKKVAAEVQKKIREVIGPSVSVGALSALGEPAAEIMRVAEDGCYDLVVLRDRDRSDAGRFLIGSITDRVVHHCRKAVLVLK